LLRAGKRWDQAGKVYERAADAYMKANSSHQAATEYLNASNSYRKTSIPESIRSLEVASSLYAQDGKFSIAAKNHKNLAELCEKELDFESAITHYEKAADYYDTDNSPIGAKQCRLKVAQYAAERGEYSKAIQIFEQQAKDTLDSRTPMGAKDLFLKAGICYLAHDDAVGLRQALGRWKDLSASFDRDREYKFLENLLESYENYDSDQFTNVVTEYNTFATLDSWKINLLAKVKEAIKGGDGEGKDERL